MKTHLYHLIRRPVALLEVMIAFALVVLCAIPLIYPHVFILRAEKQFVAESALDHQVNLQYADVMQKLYQNLIPIEEILEGKEFPLPLGVRTEDGTPLSFNGSYHFEVVKKKESSEKKHNAYLLRLVFQFTPDMGVFVEKSSKPITFEYLVPLEKGKAAAAEDENTEAEEESS
jgi:hypothetical protein